MSVGNRLGEWGGRRGLVGSGGGTSDTSELCPIVFMDFMLVLLVMYSRMRIENIPLGFAQGLHAEELP